MATSKPKPTKKPVNRAKPAARGLVSSRFKFNKLGVIALAAVLSVAGVVYVFASHASGNCATSNQSVFQCYWNSGGTEHNEGLHVAGGRLYSPTFGGSGFVQRDVWADWSPQGHDMWYGPYTTVKSSAPIRVCWYYATNPTGFEANFNVTSDSGQTPLQSKVVVIKSQDYVVNPANHIKYLGLRELCTWDPSQAAQKGYDSKFLNIPPGYYTNFEVRVKLISGYLYVYKTVWTK